MKIISLAMAAGLSAVFAVSSVVPAQALQIAPPQIEQASANIVQAKAKWKHRRGHWRGNRHYRGHRHYRNGRYYRGRHYRGRYGGGWGWPFWVAPVIVIAP
jgi:hypothetical protein